MSDDIVYRSKHKNINGHEEEIIYKYLQEWSTNSISKFYKVNIDTIFRVLKRNNVIIRSNKDARNLSSYNIKRNNTVYKKFTLIEIDEMVSLYSEGYGINYISLKYLVDDSVITRILKDKNIHIRNKNEQYKFNFKTVELFKNTIMCKFGGWSRLNEMHKAAIKLKYGVDNVMQIYDVLAKQQRSAHTVKNINIQGVEIQYQGYELKGIEYLLSIGIKINEIIIGKSNIPVIKYSFKGKDKVYFPDIYIPHINHIIEVKSQWTMKKEYEQNIAKRDACIKAGYIFDFLVF